MKVKEELGTQRLNRLRAAAARRALNAHRRGKTQRREPLNDRIVDLVTDLLHLGRRYRLRSEDLMRVARGHFQTEARMEVEARRARSAKRAGRTNRPKRRRRR